MPKKKSAKREATDARWLARRKEVLAERAKNIYPFDEEEYLGLAESASAKIGDKEIELKVLKFKTGSLGVGNRSRVTIPMRIGDEIHDVHFYVMVTATIVGSRIQKEGHVRTVRLPQEQVRTTEEYVDEHLFDCPHDPREDEEGFHPEYTNLPELDREVGGAGDPPSSSQEEDDRYP